MYAESRKVYLIEEVLKVNNEADLIALENALKKSKTGAKKNASIYDFLGMLSKKETLQMKKAIKETAEKIHANDWQ